MEPNVVESVSGELNQMLSIFLYVLKIICLFLAILTGVGLFSETLKGLTLRPERLIVFAVTLTVFLCLHGTI